MSAGMRDAVSYHARKPWLAQRLALTAATYALGGFFVALFTLGWWVRW